MKASSHSARGRMHVGVFPPARPWPLRVGFWLLLGIAAFYLFTEHRAHLVSGLSYLSLLLLVACPLIHVFAHGGHGGHSHHQVPEADGTRPARPGTHSAEAVTGVACRHEEDGK